MTGFLGSYRHSLDSKGRVSLPAPFRRSSDAESFVLIQVHEDALTLFPDATWSDVEQRLREMRERRPDFRHRILSLTGSAQRVSPDSQGRILVPERLRTSVGLGDEALIVGALDKIEVWDPDRFAEHTADENEEFDELTASIFA